MIISRKHKYLFVELPHTASTAISKELRDNYDGERILRKHSFYQEYQKIAMKGNETDFVFSCIRNPMDDVLSIYFKYKTDHYGSFQNGSFKNREKREELARQGLLITKRSLGKHNFVQKYGNEFPGYFKKFYKFPYDNWSSLDHKNFDYIIRFENLQQDFQRVLELIGLEQKRPLSIINPTREKKHYLTYYTPEIYQHAKYVFSPFMKRWNYPFPADWGDNSVPLISEILFRFFGIIRIIYWKYLSGQSSIHAKFILRLFGR